MGIAVAISSHLMVERLGVSQLARLADLAVSIPIGLAVYYGACRWLHVPDLDAAIRAIAGPVIRRVNRVRASG
jgi:hypothetical protein